MNKFLSICLLLLFGLSIASVAAPKMTAINVSTSMKFNWARLLGIGVEIDFGTNEPGCPCCYSGICHLKVGSCLVQNGPLTNTQIGDFANGLSANFQAGVAITESGEAYLIFNRAITRPEFLARQLVIQAPVGWDPELVKTYNIPQMKAGRYEITDNGLFKMIRIH